MKGEALEILINDQNVRSITYSYSKQDIPYVDTTLWNEESQDTANFILKKISDFTTGPCIEDYFQDHGQRRLWRGQMEKEHGWFNETYMQNTLKGGRWFTLLRNCRLMLNGYRGDAEELCQEIDNFRAIIPTADRYEKMNTEEKMREIEMIQFMALGILEYLSRQEPQMNQKLKN